MQNQNTTNTGADQMLTKAQRHAAKNALKWNDREGRASETAAYYRRRGDLAKADIYSRRAATFAGLLAAAVLRAGRAAHDELLGDLCTDWQDWQ